MSLENEFYIKYVMLRVYFGLLFLCVDALLHVHSLYIKRAIKCAMQSPDTTTIATTASIALWCDSWVLIASISPQRLHRKATC